MVLYCTLRMCVCVCVCWGTPYTPFFESPFFCQRFMGLAGRNENESVWGERRSFPLQSLSRLEIDMVGPSYPYYYYYYYYCYRTSILLLPVSH